MNHIQKFYSTLASYFAVLTVSLTSTAGLAQPNPSDIDIISAINSDFRREIPPSDCEIQTLNDRVDYDLTGDGKPEIIVTYSMNADVCGGGGTWSNSELAILEYDGTQPIFKSRVSPQTPDDSVFDPYVEKLSIADREIVVRISSAKPSGGGPATIHYIYQDGQLIPGERGSQDDRSREDTENNNVDAVVFKWENSGVTASIENEHRLVFEVRFQDNEHDSASCQATGYLSARYDTPFDTSFTMYELSVDGQIIQRDTAYNHFGEQWGFDIDECFNCSADRTTDKRTITWLLKGSEVELATEKGVATWTLDGSSKALKAAHKSCKKISNL